MPIKTYNLSNMSQTFIYNNIVANGSFNDTTGWDALNSTISASNNSLIITGNGTNTVASARITNLEPYISGKKYYIRANFKVTNSNCNSIQILFVVTGAPTTTLTLILTPTINTEYDLSAVGTLNAGGSGNVEMRIYHRYADAATANNKTMNVKDFLIIDLTSLFGAGNEPSAADCANIFKFVDGTLQPNFSKTLAT